MTKRFGSLFLLLGSLCILIASGFTGYNISEDRQADELSEDVLEQIQPQDDEDADGDGLSVEYAPDPDLPMPVTMINGRAYVGTVELPKQGISLPVLSEYDLNAMRAAPCRYAGSVYSRDCVIAGHNYRSHFGRLGLARVGDTVTFTDVDGYVFSYRVSKVETVKATAVDYVTSGDDWDLSLFTCTLGGKSRILVRCVLT